MATVTKPIALDESLNTTESPSRNIADVLAEELSAMITAIGGLNFINFVVVAELPTTGISTTTIYLVPSDDPQSENTYDEYINLNGTVSGWEKIGSTDIDLSGYYTSAEVDDLLADKADVSDIPTVNDGTLTIQQNGDTKGTFTANQSGNSTVNIEIPTTDIQTAVDEFETYNGGLLSSLKVALTPNQNLHGYLEPWVGGVSKQLIPMTVNALKLANAWMTWNGKVATTGSLTVTLITDDAENVICIDVDGIANVRLDFSLGWVYTDGSYVISGATNGGLSKWGVWQRGHGSDESEMSLDGAGTFTDTRQTSNECVLTIFLGATPSHQKFYPMLCLSSAPDPTVFAPYTNICPINGHAQVEVEVGTNKLNPDSIVQGNLTTSAVSVRCSTRGNLTIPISVGQTITVSRQLSTINFAIAVTDSSMSVLFDSGWQSGSCTYVSAYDGYVELVFSKQDGTDITPSDVKSANFMVEFGSAPTPYVPYTKGTYSLTVNLGGTYYSGILDVVTGVFTPDTASVDISTLDYSASDAPNHVFRTDSLSGIIKPSDNGESMPHAICSAFSGMGWNPISASDNGRFSVSTGGGRVVFIDHRYSTISDFVSGNSGTQLVYELATPTPIQLSPTMVKALVGENHLSAPLEGQEITESKYKQMFTFDDVIAYIQSLS